MARRFPSDPGVENAATSPPDRLSADRRLEGGRPAAAARDAEASEKPPAYGDALKVFISYSRADMAAADALVEALERKGFSVTIDRRDLPYGEEWQKELAAFIAESDTVLWLVSPHSVRSKWCNWELGEVGRLSKRLVPVRISDIDPDALPEALGRIHLLPAEGAYDPARHEAALVNALNTDRAWLKKATSLGERAREWLQKEREKGLLLRGASLSEAEAWSLKPPRDVPAPASEILELILASRRAQRRRQRYTVAGSIVAAVVAIGLAGTAVVYQQRAEEQATEAGRQRDVAERNEARAQEQARIATEARRDARAGEGNRIAAVSQQLVTEGKADLGAALGLDVIRASDDPDISATSSLRSALWRAISTLRLPQELNLGENPFRLVRSPDGAVFAAGTVDGWVRIVDATTLDVRTQFRFSDEPAPPTGISFSPDGRSIVVAGDRVADVWDTATGQRRFELQSPASERPGFAKDAKYGPDGKMIAVSRTENVAALYGAETGQLLHVLAGARLDDMWSRAGKTDDPIIAAVVEANFKLWGAATEIAFSDDGKLIALTGTANPDASVMVYDTATGTVVRILAGGSKPPVGSGSMTYGTTLMFLDGGKRVMASPTFSSIKVWSVETGALDADIPSEGILTMASTVDGRGVIAGHFDGSLTAHCLAKPTITSTIRAHRGFVNAIVVDPARMRMATTSGDRTAKLWRLPSGNDLCGGVDGAPSPSARLAGLQPFAILSGHASAVHSVRFSSDGRSVTTNAQDGYIRRWPMQPLQWHDFARERAMSPYDDEERDIFDENSRFEGAPTSSGSPSGPADPHRLRFDPTGRYILTKDVWDRSEGVRMRRTQDVCAIAAGLDANGPVVFRTPHDWWRLGDVATEPPAYFRCDWEGPIVAPSGQQALITRKNHHAKRFALVELATGRTVADLTDDKVSGGFFSKYFFSNDGSRLFKLIDGNNAQAYGLAAWDTSSGEEILRMQAVKGLSFAGPDFVSDDGRVVLVGKNKADDLRVFEIREGDLVQIPVDAIRRPEAAGRALTAAAISPDGRFVAAGYSDGSIATFGIGAGDEPDPARGKIVDTGGIAAEAVEVSRDGKFVAALDRSNTVWIVDVAGSELVASRTFANRVSDMRFSPDSAVLAVVDAFGEVFVSPNVAPSHDDVMQLSDWANASGLVLISEEDRRRYRVGTSAYRADDADRFVPPPRPTGAMGKPPSEAAAACDRAAAHPQDPLKRAEGIPIEKVDAATARALCTEALLQHGDDQQTAFQLARIDEKEGDSAKAMDAYLVLARRGYASAMRGVARLLQTTGGYETAGTSEDWLRKASDAGDPVATRMIALEAAKKAGTDPEPVLSLMTRQGSADHAEAALLVSVLLAGAPDAEKTLSAQLFFGALGIELDSFVARERSEARSGIRRRAMDVTRRAAANLPRQTTIDLYRAARAWQRAG